MYVDYKLSSHPAAPCAFVLSGGRGGVLEEGREGMKAVED